MASFLHDNNLDDGLQNLADNGEDFYICSALPVTYTEAKTTYALGNKTGITISQPQGGSPSGREVEITGFTDGVVTADGTATHWAIIDETNDVLQAAAPLDAAEAVVNGNPFSVPTFAIVAPDPT